MFIQTEQTPNPATLKFIPDQPVLSEGTRYFGKPEDADISPLAKRLFGFEEISAVFLSTEFMSITQKGGDWHELKPLILGAIMDHYSSGLPVLASNVNVEVAEEDTEIVRQIKDILNEKVRPAVARDGGDIVFHSFDQGIVYLHMQGACSGCPSSSMTLKNGIENLMKFYIPEVLEVRQVEG